MVKIKYKFSPLFWLIVASFLLRVIAAYFFGDQNLENEWKTLLYNLVNHKSYSFYQFNGQLLPSVYMPPMYAFLLYFLKIISFEKINFLNLVIFIQIVLSTYSIYIFYKINKNIFNEKVSLINSFFFALFPLNIYTSGQVSSINFQIFLSLLFIQYLFCLIDSQTKKNILIFSVIAALLLLTRGEFSLILIITLFYLILLKKIKFQNLVKIIAIIVLIISPYLTRNYYTFDQVTIVKSLGYNLWKGNNQLSLVEGSGFSPTINFDDPDINIEQSDFKRIKKKIQNIKIDKYYEIERDQIFLREALNNLSYDPHKYLNLFLKKIFSFYFIDFKSNYPGYYNFFHFIPVFVIGILSFPGIMIAIKKNIFKINYLLIYLFLNIVIFSSFFILPRYKLIILPIQFILTALFINYIYKKFFSKIKK